MFLPLESLYLEVVRDEGLMSRIQRECRVVITGPSTFAAMLSALQMGFRTLAIEERSSEVWKMLESVKRDFAAFASTLEIVRSRIEQASTSLNKAYTQSQKVQKQLEGVSLPGQEQNGLEDEA